MFRNAGLRAVDASVRGVKKGSATKVTISAFDKAGKQLGTATESLGDGVSSILFEDLSSE